MSSFGTLFKAVLGSRFVAVVRADVQVSTFGESHGVGVGCIVDGIPANLPLNLGMKKSSCFSSIFHP